MTSTRSTKPSPLASAELEIMQIIWERGEATINEVVNQINSQRKKSLRRTTIQVQMVRLENKGWLTHREKGRSFYYRALYEKNETRASIAADLNDRVFGGSFADLVRCLVDQKKISKKEITRLRNLIDEIEEGG